MIDVANPVLSPYRWSLSVFGGKDYDALFVMARSSIYSLAMAVRGTR